MLIKVTIQEGDSVKEYLHENAKDAQFTQLGFLRVIEDDMEYNYAVSVIVHYQKEESKIQVQQPKIAR